ncbi:MAG: DUF6614 family protein [Pseudomonadota bacterium]
MDLYHGWFNLKDGVSDVEFADHFCRYMERLKGDGLIGGYRITRKKLGLAPQFLPDFHIMVETDGLAQLDDAFRVVSRRDGTHEELHYHVNSRVQDVFFALYRDFPDKHRVRGQEKF